MVMNTLINQVRKNQLRMKNIIACTLFLALLTACGQNPSKRETLSLNGIWQVADGRLSTIPAKFERTIRVPGLITEAEPAFINPAPRLADRTVINTDTVLFHQMQDPLREAYWYRRTFILSKDIPATALLKVGKAMFGTKVYLNGQYIGEHLPCFTPGYFDLKKAIRKGENELLVSVGSSRTSIPGDIPDGFDYEKDRYISGIFDNVDLILTGAPFIRNVQVAPDIKSHEARVRISVRYPDRKVSGSFSFIIRETKSGKIAGKKTLVTNFADAGADQTIEAVIPIDKCRLWSPDDPFLYTLETSTGADESFTRFGMRELRFDPVTHQAELNGKPYFLRGSNITIYRFFEDSLCGTLPWNSDWVRTMHRKFRTDMYWNTLRYCIGFPPELWYDIADEEGIMIQDEFPIWYGDTNWNKWIKHLNAGELAVEFREWMEERWNHPSVIIWDASNETRLCKPYIDSAIAAVRKLDLSGRSWDNSYSTTRMENDIFESHPYHYADSNFKLRDMAKADIIPGGSNQNNPGTNPVIINEYGWLWLNRNGSPTTLTKQLYENLLGKNSTAEERFTTAARLIAAETEFWRCNRKAAGVLHFTALGYDRPNGQTSDNWSDLKNLIWEPQFLKYVSKSFAPLGLMLNFWQDSLHVSRLENIPVITINDLGNDWKGEIRVRLSEVIAGTKEKKIVDEQTQKISISAFGQTKLNFSFSREIKPGSYILEAELPDTPYGKITSIRNFIRSF